MILVLGIFNFIGLSLSGDFDKKLYFLLSITPLFSSVVIFSLCLFISTFTHKTKKTLGISLGIVFASYFLQVISELSKETEFLKYGRELNKVTCGGLMMLVVQAICAEEIWQERRIEKKVILNIYNKLSEKF